MLQLDLKKAPIYLAVRWEKFPLFRFSRRLSQICWVGFLLIFIVFLTGFFISKFPERTNGILFGFSLMFFTAALSFKVADVFFNSKLKHPDLSGDLTSAAFSVDQYNVAEFFHFDVAKAVARAIRLGHGHGIDASHLLYSLLQDNPRAYFIFGRLLLSVRLMQEKLAAEIETAQTSRQTTLLFAENFEETIKEAFQVAKRKGHFRISIGDLLAALAGVEGMFKKILVQYDLKAEDVENISWWIESLEERRVKAKRFWEYENLLRGGSLAKQWTAGYTLTLDRFSSDITELVERSLPEVIGHAEEIVMMERALARREMNNVLLVGEPGTGRKSMIYALAKKCLLGQSLPELNYKRVVQLDMEGLLAQLQSPEAVEVTLDQILQETVRAGNLILVIDELHNYIGQGTRPGIVDISGILAPYLRSPDSLIVGITTYDGLHRYIEQNAAILSLFEKVEVKEISFQETLLLLENLALGLEHQYKIFISYPALRQVIAMAERYFPALAFPEKALNLLDQAAVYVAKSANEQVMLPKHIAKIVTERTEIPVGEIENKEREVLLNLENLIHQRIVDQEEAVHEVATAMRRARADVTVRKGPIGTFLFLGPTGVGKTETSKALAEFYFGSEERMIRLDMSEFQEVSDIPRLIGSQTQVGLLTTPVKENPFSIVLLDEIEKADFNIRNLFLQVLDEGSITDGLGRKVDFKNTIIIATSNAGYQIILDAIKQNTEWSTVKQKLLDYLFEKRMFQPEFINRFDAMVVFKPLSKEDLLQVAELLLQKLKKNLQEKGVEFVITFGLKEKIVELGYNPIFGAREMRRVVQDKVENVLASALLSKKLTRGYKVEINPDSFELIINS